MIEKMYPAQVNSPETYLSSSIDANVTDITVDNASVLPDGENLAVIGVGADVETIKYSGKNGNILVGCIRGFQGTAKSWEAGTAIARNYTAYDHDTFINNINEINTNAFSGNASDLVTDDENLLVTQTEKDTWNDKVDKEDGKSLSTNDYTNVDKAKVDNIPSNPKYTDTIYDDSEIIDRILKVENRVDKDTTYEIANRQTDGLMSKTHFVKLEAIETGAQVNTINSVNNKTGDVVLTKEDIGLGAVNNVAITQEQVTKLANDQENVFLTQTAYDALSESQKLDPLKLYFING